MRVEMQAAAQVELHVSYMVSRVRWWPVYDLRVYGADTLKVLTVSARSP